MWKSWGFFSQLQGQWHAIFRDIKDSRPVPAGESRKLEHLSMQMLRAGMRIFSSNQCVKGTEGKTARPTVHHRNTTKKTQLRSRNELWAFSRCRVTQQRSELSSLWSNSSAKGEKRVHFPLNPFDTRVDRWRGADHTAGGNTLISHQPHTSCLEEETCTVSVCARPTSDVLKTGGAAMTRKKAPKVRFCWFNAEFARMTKTIQRGSMNVKTSLRGI